MLTLCILGFRYEEPPRAYDLRARDITDRFGRGVRRLAGATRESDRAWPERNTAESE